MSETEFHGSSSVGAATTPPPPPLSPHYHSQHQQHQFLSHGSVTVTPQPQHQQHQKSLSLAQRMQGDICFRCHQQGHWAIYCPFKTPPSKSKPSTSTPSPTSALDLPLLRCRCGRYCLVRVAQTDKNPGRKFYTCPGVNGTKCKFFKWCDEVKTNGEVKTCFCRAGPCAWDMMTSGPNAGRGYFVCRVPKGQGACHFLQWEDTQEITTINDLVDESKHGISVDSTSTSHELITKMGGLSIKNLKRKFDSLEVENSQHLPTSVAVHEHFEKDQEPVIERSEHDETSENLTSTKYIDPSRVEDSSNLQDLVKLEVKLSSIMKKSLLTTHLTSQAEIHCQQAEFWRQITAAGDTSTEVTDCISQILGLHILGWLGRLAFPPPRCLLVLPPRPLFCCVFPNFDPIFVPQDKDVSNCEGSADLHHSPSIVEFDETSSQISCRDAQSSSELSTPKSPPALLEGRVTTLNMDVLGQTVLHVQNQLLTHLESMNPLEHESMTQVVESTFIVLDRLLVNYTPFQELVKEFIACASSFADIEQSINNERSFQELMERYHSEKVRYDDISRIHDEIMTAFADSNRRLHSLREEASCVKELLLRIENQLSSCEAETKELETRVGEVSRDMLESQKSLQTASQEAEEATKLCHQREQKRNAAKAALEMARIKLRQ
nr:dna topoisomerase 3-alpha [Quercus suber]